MTDDYAVMASYYDAGYATKEDLDDVQFWVDEAKAADGDVLEIGCGTGRVLMPTAAEGIAIDGVDASPAMLRVLRIKLAEEPELKEKVRLFAGDMRGFALGKRYALVTMPFRPMQHLYAIDDQLAALVTAKRHLADEGQLIFDVFDPKLDRLVGGVGDEVEDLRFPDPDGGNSEVVRSFAKHGVDVHAQIFWGEMIYRHLRDGEVVLERREPFQMGWYTYAQCRLLLRLAGLTVIAEYGDFDRRAIGEGGNMIFVAGR